jgi:glyceraldehyde-3-phosphate dehydrogenase/erythrose-4-phosphate dehydrogenase
MSLRVAINGFGRVGRAALRASHEHEADIEWAAINDLGMKKQPRESISHHRRV